MTLTFQQEAMAACWEEFLAAAAVHHAETRSYRRHEPFAPSRERYVACEQSGMLRCLTARDATGTFAGYFVVYVTTSMHSQRPILVEDVFFLLPAYRKGRNAIRFIRYCEDRAREWGVEEILFSCEDENVVANKLLMYLDYEPAIRQYRKRLHPLIEAFRSGRRLRHVRWRRPAQINLEPTAPHPTEELSHVRTQSSSPS